MLEIENQLRVAAEEIMSYVESEPILKQSAHAEKLHTNPEWVLYFLALAIAQARKSNRLFTSTSPSC